MPTGYRVCRFVLPGKPRAWKRPNKRRPGDPNAPNKDWIRGYALVAGVKRLLDAPGATSLEIEYHADHTVVVVRKGGEPVSTPIDGDNGEKLILDSLVGICYADDRYVRSVTWTWPEKKG